jgi:hypothetical protein
MADTLADIKNDLGWTKRIGWWIAGAFSAVFVGLITWYLPKQLDNNRELSKKDITEQLSPIGQDIAALKAQVATIIPQLMKEKLNTKGAELQRALETVASIAETSKDKQIDTDSAAIGEIGAKVIQIGATNGHDQIANAAWQATTQLLNYKSFLNSKTAPDISGAIPVTQAPVKLGVTLSGHAVPPYPGYDHPVVPVNMRILYVGPITPLESSDAAIAEPLNQDPSNHLQNGPKYYVVEGKGFEYILDGYRMRNIIFKDVTIIYDGGPVALQNVYLVNCTFKFKPTPDWQRLSNELFAKASVDFFKTASP